MPREKVMVDIGVRVILRDGNRVFLSQRKQGALAGRYDLPYGHLKPKENLIEGLLREAREEFGIHLQEEDLNFMGVVHHIRGAQSIDFIFECTNWDGVVENLEPDNCGAIGWFDIDHLPEHILHQAEEVLETYVHQRGFLIELEDIS